MKVEARLDLSGLTLLDLVRAAREIFLSKPDLPALSRVVTAPRVTIREKIRSILDSLQKYSMSTFRSFLKRRNDRLEIVVTFLAMLELIKRQVIDATQAELFGEIELKSTGEWDDKEDSSLEFIE